MQYEKDDGIVGILRGDQKVTRGCQVNMLKLGIKEKLKMMSHVLMTVRLNSMQSVDQPQPVHGFEKIVVWGDEKKIRVGKSMSPGIGESIINVIKKFRDIFAYTVEVMPGISPRNSFSSFRHQAWLQASQAKT